MSTELLPCPFCGNDKNIAVANEKHNLSGGYFIACPKCHASTGLRYACGDDPIPLLAEQWNRRASRQQAEGAAPAAPEWPERAYIVAEMTMAERHQVVVWNECLAACKAAVEKAGAPTATEVQALRDIKHKLEIGRIWNGTGWHWNPIRAGVAEACWKIADTALAGTAPTGQHSGSVDPTEHSGKAVQRPAGGDETGAKFKGDPSAS